MDTVHKILVCATIFSICSAQYFCDGVCLKSGCTGNTRNDCNGNCMLNWVANGTTCSINTAIQWNLIDTTSDLPGGLIAVNTTGPSTTVCPPFTLFGLLHPIDTLGLTHYGSTKSYFQLTVYLWLILLDLFAFWSNDSIMSLVFVQGNVTTTNKVSVYAGRINFCGLGNTEVVLRMTATYHFLYNGTMDELDWYIFTNETNTNAPWAIK